MDNYDGSVRIDTEIDSSGVTKGLKGISKQIDNFAKNINKKTKGVQDLALGFNSVTKSVEFLSNGLKSAVAALRDLADAYQTQQLAEIQLETAAKHNPYLDEHSVQKLKNYASELQEIGTIGDETLIPMMAQLAASGRTYTEIQQIMAAALDASASGAISLDSAVQGLNMSYSGQVGALGRQLPMLKDLTEEELKNGKAVEVVANAYKGMAKQTADATGSTQKLKNAWGDFKETIGMGIDNIISPIESAIASIITRINDAWNKAKKIKDEGISEASSLGVDTNNSASDRNKAEKAARKEREKQRKKEAEEEKKHESTLNEIARSSANDRIKIWQEANEKSNEEIVKLQQTLADTYDAMSVSNTFVDPSEQQSIQEIIEATAAAHSISAELAKDILLSENKIKAVQIERKEILEEEYNLRRQIKDENDLLTAEEVAAAEAERKRTAALEESSDNYKKIIAERDAAIAQIKRTAEVMGEEVDLRAILNAELSAYLKMAQDPNLATKTNEQKERVKELVKDVKDLDLLAARIKEATEQVAISVEALNRARKATTPAGQLKEQLAEMKKAKEAIKAMTDEEVRAAQKDAGTDYSKEELLQGIAEAERQITEDKVNEPVRIEESGFDRIREENEKLLEMKQAINDSEVLSAEEKAEKIREIENSIARNNIDTFAGIMEQVGSYAKQVTNTMQQAADIMLQTVKYQTDAELATLEKKYLQGEINEEEYQEERIKAKKKAAKEEYKINLFQWSASILTATADIAAGAAKSISLGFPMGIIAMALTMAAGAVQIASLIAAKPTPPSFAGGGIVQGGSYRGDNVRANVNSGEMILNATQQKALWEVANGRETRGSGINLNITNKAANVVSATPKIDRNQMDIVIDMRVNDSLKNGRYDQSLEAAEAGMGGVFYGI